MNPALSDRKKDHIDLATASIPVSEPDPRFYYEPFSATHPRAGENWPFRFLDKDLHFPVWISSMTGGTALAKTINTNLARMCKDFGFGFALGSCRKLIEKPELLSDFDVRKYLGDSFPLFANIGVAQAEQWISAGHQNYLHQIVDQLSADGLIIHINPLQEWMQSEGDRIHVSPITTLHKILDYCSYPIIVKEVGQGMGPQSIQQILQLPIAAFEFAAFGGTNFSTIENARNDIELQAQFEPFTHIGHTALEMLEACNRCVVDHTISCKHLIISGGIKNYLDGYYLISQSKIPAVYGQAGSFLKHAKEDYEPLHAFAQSQMEGLLMAKNYLRIKNGSGATNK